MSDLDHKHHHNYTWEIHSQRVRARERSSLPGNGSLRRMDVPPPGLNKLRKKLVSREILAVCACCEVRRNLDTARKPVPQSLP
jgi:hypothetical protein